MFSTIPGFLSNVISPNIIANPLSNIIIPNSLITSGELSKEVNVSFPIPIAVTSPPYIDLNNDKNVIYDILQKIYYNKFLPNWSRHHYTDLYSYIKVSNGKANYISDINNLDNNNNEENIKLKHKFIIDLVSPNKMLKIIDKFRKKNRINMWDIKDDYEIVLRKYIHHVIKEKMLDKINKN